jgi:RNA polymerase sigma factor (sigma-70 family)
MDGDFAEIENDSGRNRTITEVIRKYSTRLFGFIRGRVSSNADAEDILQEVWYQLSKVVEIESIEQVSSWLFRVARNKVTDNYRKNKPALLEDYAYEHDDGTTSIKEILLADFNTPETETLKEMFWETLLDSLEELPEKQRAVFVLNELEGKTLQQIADESGENIKTLISRKRYAVQHLRVQLQDLYDELINY